MLEIDITAPDKFNLILQNQLNDIQVKYYDIHIELPNKVDRLTLRSWSTLINLSISINIIE